MSTTAKSDKASSWITIAIVIVVGIWFFKGCSERSNSSSIELKGIGMLEERGIYGELPPSAGSDYYYMRNEGSGEYQNSDYEYFFAQIKAYQAARSELRKRGLSNSDLSAITERELYEAVQSGNPAKALDDLAKRYD